MARRLSNDTRLRLIIDGVIVPTTAGLLRKSTQSLVVSCAFAEFERELRARPITGRASQFHEPHMNRSVNIQIDITA